jgi:hypothetical protein
VSTTNGSSLTAVNGNWNIDGTNILAQSIRGSLSCNLQVDPAGLYALDIVVRDAGENNPSSDFVLDVVLEGITLGTLTIPASGIEPGMGHLILPWMTAGSHAVNLVWRNGRANALIRIDSVRLVKLDQTDADNNGEADWIEPYFQSTFSFDGTPVDTFVSPYTVEGKSAYPLFLKLNCVLQTTPASAATELEAKQGLATQFYADVPLNSSAAAKVTVLEANGLRVGTKTITWKSLNLASPISTTMIVRKDCRLLFEANDSLAPTANYQLRIVAPNGTQSTLALASAQKMEALFDQPGQYQLYLTPEGGGERKSLVVTVRQISLTPVPTLFVYGTRTVAWGNLPPGPIIQTDPTMSVTSDGTGTSPQNLTISAYSRSRAVLRLDGENSPIVDAVTVDPIRSYNDEESTSLPVGTLPDGTVIYRFSTNFEGKIPADLRIVIKPFTGATFRDGSIEKTITAADIGSDGRYVYYLYVKNGGTSTCHSVGIYSGANEVLYSY